MMDISPNSASFLRRFWIYLQERFPLFAHGPLIAIFTFSAVSYSRICRGAEGFILLKDYLIGIFLTIGLFLLVRIFDEFKDKEEDAKFRTYLPVPRGLISLNELKWVGILLVGAQLTTLLLFQPSMLWLYVMVLAYLCLMGVEFFVPTWLKSRQILYITSHMLIIPLVDVYSTGLDWVLADEQPSVGLLFFFAVSYFNGMVLEFGRKIRAPHKEEEGVISYTSLYGTQGGVIVWLSILTLTVSLSIGAAWFAGYGWLGVSILFGCYLLCATPGILFLQDHTEKRSTYIEYASGIWTAVMYLTLGAVPMLTSLI